MKKFGIAVLQGCFIVCLLISLLGCRMDPDPQMYLVTFDTDGGSTVASQSVQENTKVMRSTDPTKSGYSFDTWYTEDTFDSVWNFA